MPIVNFTLRQWAIIAGLAAVFIVAAIVVSRDEPAPSTAIEPDTFDEVVWCETANAISRWRSILDGSVEGDTPDDVINLRETLDDARSIAPTDLRTDVARLYDYALLTAQAIERNDGDVGAGVADAKGNTDQERVNQALERVNDSVVACGHPPLTEQTA